MTPEQKKHIDAFLKEMGSDNTVDQLEAIRKRCVRTLGEWSAQDTEQRKAMPQEVNDMKMVSRYTLLATITGMAPLIEALAALDMAVEAAYNLGKVHGAKSNAA